MRSFACVPAVNPILTPGAENRCCCNSIRRDQYTARKARCSSHSQRHENGSRVSTLYTAAYSIGFHDVPAFYLTIHIHMCILTIHIHICRMYILDLGHACRICKTRPRCAQSCLFGESSLVVPFVFVVLVLAALRRTSRILVPFDKSERWRCFDVNANPGQRQAEGGAQ
jgi:hypothetical protein